MRVLITGGEGLLGRNLIATRPSDVEALGSVHAAGSSRAGSLAVELSDGEQVDALVGEVRPDLIIHTAYKQVDGLRNIVLATRNVAAAAQKHQCGLIHMSTDLVFDGEKGPYYELDVPTPVNEYGKLKAQAELEVQERHGAPTIVRSSLILSLDPLDGPTAWVVEGARAGRQVPLFVDEIRCPLSAGDLARTLWELARLPRETREGIWHVAGPEALSRFALGLLIAANQGVDHRHLIPSRSSNASERRPRDTRLATSRANLLTSKIRGASEFLTMV